MPRVHDLLRNELEGIWIDGSWSEPHLLVVAKLPPLNLRERAKLAGTGILLISDMHEGMDWRWVGEELLMVFIKTRYLCQSWTCKSSAAAEFNCGAQASRGPGKAHPCPLPRSRYTLSECVSTSSQTSCSALSMANSNPKSPRKRGTKAASSAANSSSNGTPSAPSPSNLPPPATSAPAPTPTPAPAPAPTAAKPTKRSRTPAAARKPKAAPTPPAPPAPPDPVAVRDTSDPGDATQRNFRYQHAYGVILLAGCRRGARHYVAIWCEHHEDLLGQRPDGCCDGFQIKTSRPENGPWRMLDPEMVKTIGRFVDLVKEFGDRIGDLFFVTNTEFDHVADDHKDEKRKARRPRAFLEHVRSCNKHGDISALFLTTFKEIQGQCSCQEEELFVVLKRMNLVLGPSRDAFLAVVSHEHLGQIDGCTALSPGELDTWRDRLIALVCAASSLAVTDPIRHLRPLIDATGVDPSLTGKRLLVAEVMVYNPTQAPFVFPGPPQLALGAPPRPQVLQAKLEKGKIEDQVEYLRTRERAAEAHLMEEALRDSKRFPAMLRQLEEVVLGECTEANLRARADGEPFGARMLISIQDRLRKLATEEPKKVFYRTYECLMGLVGLLSTDTRVWFSPRFPIQESAA